APVAGARGGQSGAGPHPAGRDGRAAGAGMTVVRTTEPPRLPVRDRAAARERGWGGVSPMLTRLAAERATGVLIREHGTLHLAEGLVVQAESRHAPGLGALLTARGTLAPEAWQQALDEAADHHRVGRHLVDAGRP